MDGSSSADASARDSALAEIAQIDFLLNEIARAVERGEVHRASYDLMAPRHLDRRADLVAFVTGVPREPQPTVSGAAVGASLSGVPPVRQTGPQAFDQYSPREHAHREPARVSVPRKPVDWTTVLLFLGAFLVIVASAIFSVAVWGDLDTLSKVGFLGLLTVGFYAAGWWARTRLKLLAGSVALTAVASVMLLFDGWIIIDGYGLEGPLPWAALLLFCSAVYWFTETRIASGFFGVVGAAAQVAWWWLLGAGLELPVTTRIAGIALVALVWQIAAVRGRGKPAVGSLAAVLEWAAPVVAIGAALAMLVDLAWIRGSSLEAVLAAGVVAVAGGFVVGRARVIPPAARMPAAAALQTVLLASAWVATIDAGSAWWVLAVFVAAAIAYDVVGIGAGGACFLVAGLFAETSAVIELCRILDLSATTTLAALAALAAVWALSARLVGRTPAELIPEQRARTVALVTETAAWTVLAACSLMLPIAQWAVPLPGFEIARTDALGYVAILAAWWAAVAARPRGAAAVAGSVWAFVTLSALLAWTTPDASLEAWAACLVALAGVWLASASAQAVRFGAVWAVVTRWSSRGFIAGFYLLGTVPTLAIGLSSNHPFLGVAPEWHPVVLGIVTAAILCADSLREGCEASAAGVGVAIPTTGVLVVAAVPAWDGVTGAGAMAAAGTALMVAGVAFALRRHRRAEPLAAWFAAASVAAATLHVASLTPTQSPAATIAWTLVAVGWALAAALTSQWVVLAAGTALVPAVWSALGASPDPVISLVALGALGLALGSLSWWPPAGADGRLRDAGAALAAAGVLAHVSLLLDGGLDAHLVSLALLLLAVTIASSSAAHRFEPGYYVAGLTLVLAVWNETGLVSDAPAVLYATPLALYLVAAGYLYVRLGREGDIPRDFPVALDVFAVLVGLGYPLLAALGAPGDRALAEALAVVIVSLVAIGAGVALKVRWWFFGGVVALAVVAFYRSFSAIAEYWWVVLGIVGVAMLVIALTWQRQRMIVVDTRERLRRSFEGWR